MSREQIIERIGQINEAIDTLKQHGLNSVSAISPDNQGGDDSSSEASMDQSALGQIGQELDELERERTELEAKLHELK